MKINATDLIDRLTNDDIIKLMSYLEADLSPRSNNQTLIFTTVCHNGDSHKLYYYSNTKRFQCYSHCGNMSVFDVVMKAKDIDFKSALDFIYSVVGNYSNKPTIGFVDMEKSYDLEDIIYEELPPIEKQYLYNVFKSTDIKSWLNEGISRDTMRKYNIRYDDKDDRIIIPHFSKENKCVGIRCRNMNELKIMKGLPKYMPLFYGGVGYNHSLGSNLYGLNISKENIKKYHKVIIFEGEKSCMKYDTFYPQSNISVAICGSNFGNIQKKILIDLGVQEIVLALDKEFEVYGDQESIEYEKKIIRQLEGIKNYCKCSYIIDKNNLLDKKDAPIDKGKEIFIKLINNRVEIGG